MYDRGVTRVALGTHARKPCVGNDSKSKNGEHSKKAVGVHPVGFCHAVTLASKVAIGACSEIRALRIQYLCVLVVAMECSLTSKEFLHLL